jgi:tetratricopeptide (TPR) repeat protein
MASAGLGNGAAALGDYQHALRYMPDYLPALEGAAQLKYQQENDEARPFLLRILSQRPDDPTTHAMLAVLDYRRKDCPQAVTHFQSASSVIDDQPSALGQYGTCLAILKRYDQAIRIFQDALALDPGAADTRYNLALSQWNANHPSDAVATLQPLLQSQSTEEKYLLLGAALYESLKETQPAIDLLRTAILANPKNPEAYLQVAYLSYDHGSPKIGIDYLTAGLTQLPREARFYLVRGVLYSQFGEFVKATEDFQAANRINPHLSFVDVSMGVVESQEHNSAAALAQFRAAAKKHPEQGLPQYLLAEAISHEEHPDEKEEIEAANRALQDDQQLVAAHDLLANLYLHKGRMNLAIRHSEAALKVDPNDREALYHLVLAVRGTDRKNEIPALLKRMNSARQQEHNPQTGVFKLSEIPRLQKSVAP